MKQSRREASLGPGGAPAAVDTWSAEQAVALLCTEDDSFVERLAGEGVAELERELEDRRRKRLTTVREKDNAESLLIHGLLREGLTATGRAGGAKGEPSLQGTLCNDDARFCYFGEADGRLVFHRLRHHSIGSSFKRNDPILASLAVLWSELRFPVVAVKGLARKFDYSALLNHAADWWATQSTQIRLGLSDAARLVMQLTNNDGQNLVALSLSHDVEWIAVQCRPFPKRSGQVVDEQRKQIDNPERCAKRMLLQRLEQGTVKAFAGGRADPIPAHEWTIAIRDAWGGLLDQRNWTRSELGPNTWPNNSVGTYRDIVIARDDIITAFRSPTVSVLESKPPHAPPQQILTASSEAKLRLNIGLGAWYTERVERYTKLDIIPSQDADHDDAAAAGFSGASRPILRALREAHATGWIRGPGRPKQKSPKRNAPK